VGGFAALSATAFGIFFILRKIRGDKKAQMEQDIRDRSNMEQASEPADHLLQGQNFEYRQELSASPDAVEACSSSALTEIPDGTLGIFEASV
jgi:hypothetical protein